MNGELRLLLLIGELVAIAIALGVHLSALPRGARRANSPRERRYLDEL